MSVLSLNVFDVFVHVGWWTVMNVPKL